MYIYNERVRMREISANFPTWVKSPNWGIAIWNKDKQQAMLKEVQALDPETATSAEYIRIMGAHFKQQRSCHECGVENWEIVVFESKDSDRYDSCICKSCLAKAVALTE